MARDGEVPVPPSRSHFPDRSSRMSPVFNVAEWHLRMLWPRPIVYNRTHVSGLLVTDRPSVVKLCAGEHTAPDKFFTRGPGRTPLFSEHGPASRSGRAGRCNARCALFWSRQPRSGARWAESCPKTPPLRDARPAGRRLHAERARAGSGRRSGGRSSATGPRPTARYGVCWIALRRSTRRCRTWW